MTHELRALRHLILVLACLFLPVQSFAAAVMSVGAASASSSHRFIAADNGSNSALPPCHQQSANNDGSLQDNAATAAIAPGDHHPHSGKPATHPCATCCTALATPPAALSTPPASDLCIGSFCFSPSRLAGFIPDLPTKPPRRFRPI